MAGFGVGPYGLMPFGTVTEPYDEQLPTNISSSRRIDFTTGRYELDDASGGFDHMDDVYQRIGLLLAYATPKPGLIGESFEAERELQIREALRPLTHSRPQLIRITSIVTTTSGGSSQTAVRFKKFGTETEQVLEV